MAAASEPADIFSLPAAPDDIDLTFLDNLLEGGSLELPLDDANPWCNPADDLTLPISPKTEHLGASPFPHQQPLQPFTAHQPSTTAAPSPESTYNSNAPSPASSHGDALNVHGQPAGLPQDSHSPSGDATSSHVQRGSAPNSPGGGVSGGRGRRVSSSEGSAKTNNDSSDNSAAAEEDEKKKAIRMQRNRESAQLSRQRKKLQMSELEKKNSELTNQNKYLSGVVSHLQAENMGLRQQLMHVCQQTNTPLPAMPPPSVPMMPGMPMVMPMPGYVMGPCMAPAGAPGAPMAYPMYAPGACKMPLPKLDKPARPEPAVKPNSAAAKRGGGKAGGTVNKKAKVAAGASAAMMAMFAVVMLFAPGGPSGGPAGPLVEPYAALPQANPASGRVMLTTTDPINADISSYTSADSSSRNTDAVSQKAIPLPPVQRELAQGDSDSAILDGSEHGKSNVYGKGNGNGHVGLVPMGMSGEEEGEWEIVNAQSVSGAAGSVNSTSLSLNGSSEALAWLTDENALLHGSAARAELEGKALQRLLDASNTALVWDPDWVAEQPALLDVMPQWGSFPALLGNSLQAEGLISPLTCDKVFEVEAASLPDASKLKKRMESYLSSLQGFKGRAVALPPAESDPTAKASQQGQKGLPLGGKGDMLVSVVLPVKPQGSGMLTALDRLFVVLLQQSTVYATYSCQLPKAGFI